MAAAGSSGMTVSSVDVCLWFVVEVSVCSCELVMIGVCYVSSVTLPVTVRPASPLCSDLLPRGVLVDVPGVCMGTSDWT